MRKKVLIVEDNLVLAYLMESYLEESGCAEVIGSVDNGADAIQMALDLNPDVILMDIRIEGDIDGIETADMINESSDIPIIYTSGNSEQKTTNRAKKTNMQSFLVKPVDKQELIKLICSAKKNLSK